MSQEQLVEKITHLENQIKGLQTLELSIKNTLCALAYYTRRINKYSREL